MTSKARVSYLSGLLIVSLIGALGLLAVSRLSVAAQGVDLPKPPQVQAHLATPPAVRDEGAARDGEKPSNPTLAGNGSGKENTGSVATSPDAATSAAMDKKDEDGKMSKATAETEKVKPPKAPEAGDADVHRNAKFKCGVCLHLVNKFYENIEDAKIEHPYKVQTRYRLDEKRLVAYAYSEPFLYSVIDAEHSKSWWGDVGFVRTGRNPQHVRLVREPSSSDSKPRDDDKDIDVSFYGVFEGPSMDRIRTIWRKLHKELVEDYDEKLVELLKNDEHTPDSVKLEFCVKTINGCPAWPMKWGELSDMKPTTASTESHKSEL